MTFAPYCVLDQMALICLIFIGSVFFNQFFHYNFNLNGSVIFRLEFKKFILRVAG